MKETKHTVLKTLEMYKYVKQRVIIHLPLSTFPPVILTTLPPISVNSPPYV